jgi:hypothetical protein
MQHMAARHQIERFVGGVQRVEALVRERQPRRKPRVARSRDVEMRIDDVDAEHARRSEELGKPRRSLARSASGIENGRLLRQAVTQQQRRLLRPDGLRLRGERAHHRFVGHLCGLRIEVDHRIPPATVAALVRRNAFLHLSQALVVRS